MLVGREREQERLAALSRSGGSLLIVGEPGVGKSALLATLDGHLVTGVEAEQDLPYAGLHQVLHPFLDLSTVPGVRRVALEVVFGLSDGPAPPLHLVGLAALDVLSAARRVVLVDDAHWLDAASQDVLGFVARRLTGSVLVVAARTPVFAGVPTMVVEPLSAADAQALLDSVAPALNAERRSSVLAQADGNPLALTELPFGGATLEEAFAARCAALPAEARSSLLSLALGGAPCPDLAPAVEARLVGRDGGFRHPLIRSAVVRFAGPSEVRDTHRRLAFAVEEPERRAWHLAEASSGADENVACLLEKTADRALARGGAVAAVRALERAAVLGSADARVRRSLRAAELAAEAGRRDDVERILAGLRGLDLTARERALVTWLPTAFDDGVGVAGPAELVGLAESVAADDVELGLRIFWSVAMRCFWVEPGTAVRDRIAAIARRLPIDPRDPRMLAMAAYVCPVQQSDAVVAGLRTPSDDPATLRLLGSAALQVGAFTDSVRLSRAAGLGFRAQGQFGLLARALAVEAWSRTRLGDLCAPLAREAALLAEETSQPYMHGLAVAVQAEIAALQGCYERCAELAAEAERIGLAAGARPVLATVQLARSLAALGEGRYADAYAAILRVHDPADPAYQLALRRYVLPELAEAATRSGNADEARKIVEELDTTTASPALASGLRYARALLAPEPEQLFETALDAESSPWDRARVRLAFGEWLRRQRRAAQARPHLKAAAEAFEAFGTVDWAERAREELRASGESRGVAGELTEHELTIARLAADGLTNKEIGERLHLSHRTVSTHLHRIFPKLGVTARAELKEALAEARADE
ncbi:LuxR C-terminal-related transcriptional regulator [Lentzea sp. JNUCC 0626]|uniref:LuxR C-terminal-related transcriptional regulator n=1 Tax=Lentzea sp. JNUCC 0626 TaxID=3367513 RepID=UPI00374A7064